MVEVLFLLLPLAFYSGWRAAAKHIRKQQQQQCELSDSFVKGVNYLLSEQPDKALEVFLNYPDIDEYTVETYQLLGNMFRSRGEVDRALRVHQNLIARSNLNPAQKEKAMFSLGEDFLSAGMMDRAEGVFQELMDNISKSHQVSKASVCWFLRSIFEQTQEWRKAIEASNCIIDSEKKTPKRLTDEKTPKVDNQALIAHYYCELADEALHQGNIHEVEQLMNNARKAHKQSPRLMTLQGDVAFHQQMYKLALKHYLAAIKTDSRLLSMLFEKLETAASKTNSTQNLQKELIKLYKKQRNKSFFEAMLELARKHTNVIHDPDIKKELDQLIESELSSKKLNIESIYKATEYIKLNEASQGEALAAKRGLLLTSQALQNYLQGLPAFSCEHCGYQLHNYLWRCPACQQWDTIKHS